MKRRYRSVKRSIRKNVKRSVKRSIRRNVRKNVKRNVKRNVKKYTKRNKRNQKRSIKKYKRIIRGGNKEEIKKFFIDMEEMFDLGHDFLTRNTYFSLFMTELISHFDPEEDWYNVPSLRRQKGLIRGSKGFQWVKNYGRKDTEISGNPREMKFEKAFFTGGLGPHVQKLWFKMLYLFGLYIKDVAPQEIVSDDTEFNAILEFAQEVAMGPHGDQICEEIKRIYTAPTEPGPVSVSVPAPALAVTDDQEPAPAPAPVVELTQVDDSRRNSLEVYADSFLDLLAAEAEAAAEPAAEPGPASAVDLEGAELQFGMNVMDGKAVQECLDDEEMVSLIKDLLRNKEFLILVWNDFNGGVSLRSTTIRDFLEVIISSLLTEARLLRLSVNPQLIERVTANITDYSYENDRGGILNQEGFIEYLNTIVLYSGTIND